MEDCNKNLINKITVDSSFSFAEILNENREKVEKRKIYNNEISKIIYSHE